MTDRFGCFGPYLNSDHRNYWISEDDEDEENVDPMEYAPEERDETDRNGSEDGEAALE